MMFSQCNSQLTELIHVDHTYHIQFAITTEQGVRIRPHILNLNLKFTKRDNWESNYRTSEISSICQLWISVS